MISSRSERHPWLSSAWGHFKSFGLPPNACSWILLSLCSCMDSHGACYSQYASISQVCIPREDSPIIFRLVHITIYQTFLLCVPQVFFKPILSVNEQIRISLPLIFSSENELLVVFPDSLSLALLHVLTPVGQTSAGWRKTEKKNMSLLGSRDFPLVQVLTWRKAAATRVEISNFIALKTWCNSETSCYYY